MRMLSQGDPNRRVGVWKRQVRPNGRASAIVSCPYCGSVIPFTAYHEVDLAGGVTPGVQCPNKDCKFHEYVKLMGWIRQQA